MNLKNYTSSVPASTSISYIEQELVSNGATSIGKLYSNGVCVGIQFQIFNPNDPRSSLPVQLPAKVDEVFNILYKEVRRPRPGTKELILQQAQRTAWKLVYDWVAIQMSMIRLKQVDFLQIFLSYVLVEGKPYYETLKSGNFLALENHVHADK